MWKVVLVLKVRSEGLCLHALPFLRSPQPEHLKAFRYSAVDHSENKLTNTGELILFFDSYTQFLLDSWSHKNVRINQKVVKICCICNKQLASSCYISVQRWVTWRFYAQFMEVTSIFNLMTRCVLTSQAMLINKHYKNWLNYFIKLFYLLLQPALLRLKQQISERSRTIQSQVITEEEAFDQVDLSTTLLEL